MIEAKNLHKYYDQLHVLKGVDLHIKQGDCFYCRRIWCGQNNITTNFRTLKKALIKE
jgi:ABC-type polar amino acid transport system ATPase subunit